MKSYITPILLFVFVFCAAFAPEAQAQDPRFSQYLASPQNLNSAMTGVYDGTYRATANYRDQWGSVLGTYPFRTYSIGVEGRFFALKEDFFGVGVSFLGDEVGTSRYRHIGGNLNASYMKRIGGNRFTQNSQYLIIGVQAGMMQQSMNWSNFRYSTQFDADIPDGFNGGLNSGEAVGAENISYVDFGAGLMWYATVENGKTRKTTNYYIGFAMHHLNQPKISFFDGSGERLYRRYTIYGGIELPVSSEFTLMPGFMTNLQGPSMETDIGFMMRYSNKDWGEFTLKGGLYDRITKAEPVDGGGLSNDAFIVIAGVEWEQWALGLSYDVNVSGFTPATNSRGAFEVSISYTAPPKDRMGMDCPKFK